MTSHLLVLGVLLVIAGGLLYLTAIAIPKGPSTLLALASVITAIAGALTAIAAVTANIVTSVT